MTERPKNMYSATVPAHGPFPQAHVALGLILMLLIGCGQKPGEEPEPVCGNGVQEGNEACDGMDLASGTCVDLGFAEGLLRCGADCRFDTTLCQSAIVCGDGALSGSEQCDDGNTVACDGCSAECRLEECGNGVRECGETCDDGNTAGGDGCAADCGSDETCGNGVVDLQESCDEGSANSDITPDACRTDCTVAGCGDGVMDAGEVCDDGNLQPGDGCSPDCVSDESCGNGITDPGEDCDDGTTNSDTVADACRTDCTAAGCGDGVADTGEVCDDGNLQPGDGCSPDCLSDESCGNGITDPSEDCDDGTTNSDTVADACRTDCTAAGCGDGVTDSGEACDDGTLNSDSVADACRTDCTTAHCGDGVVDTGETCDDGAANSDILPNACRTSCLPAHCGDGVTDAGEDCDASSLPTAACTDVGFHAGTLSCAAGCSYDTSSCTNCGNGVLDTGEQCDGNDLGGLGCGDVSPHPEGPLSCTPSCSFDAALCHTCGDGVAQGAEACDGTDLAGADCTIFGYAHGNPGCTSACALESSGCFAVCGDANTETGEQCDDGNTTDWDGCNDCEISEFIINTTSTADQRSPDVALRTNGLAVVVWESGHLGSSNYYEIMGQRIAASGQDLGSEHRVNTHLPREQWGARVEMTNDDRYLVTWQSRGQDDFSHHGVYARRYGANGSPISGELQVNTYVVDEQRRPAVGLNDSGEGILVWQSEDQDGNADGVYAKRVSSSLGFSGSEFRINTTTLWDQRLADAAVAANGELVVVWQSNWQDGDYWGVFGRRYSASGSPIGGEFQINQSIAADQHYAMIAMAPDGQFVVVWLDYYNGGWIHPIGTTYARRFASDTTPLGPEFVVSSAFSPGPHGLAHVAMAADGSFVVIWEGIGGCCLWRRRFQADGTPAEDDVMLRQLSTYSISDPRIAMAADGRHMIVWQVEGWDGDGATIVGQRYTADGTPIGRAPW